MAEVFVTCPCQNCGKGIEFDRSELRFAETRTIECPHCHLETIVFDRDRRTSTAKIEAPPLPKKQGTTLLQIACILMFLLGLVLVVAGCAGEVGENTPEAGVIRQVVYTLQYGIGFALIGLSVVLAALIRIITGE